MTASAPALGLLRDRLAEARNRTLELVAPLSDSDLGRQHNPLMSPIVWDLGHIAHFEEVWLLENIDGAASGAEGLRGIYDAFRHPRATRDRLPLPDHATCLDYLADVRRAVLRRMERIDPAADTPLLRGGYVFNMVLQHEYQHNETILQTLQLMEGERYAGFRPGARPTTDRRGARASRPAPNGMGHGKEPRTDDMVRFPGGEVFVGTDDRSQAYDNERPRTRLRVEPFRIDRHPVGNAAFMDFIAAGGYRTDAHWSEAGLAWRAGERAEAPLFWFRRDGGWWTRAMGGEVPVDPALPVCHVSWYEADAFARRAGKRLPTEAEWEVAASWDPVRERAVLYPWGDEPATPSRANLDAVRSGPARAGSHPGNVSPLGCYGMIGDVWEWTASRFLPYPGFQAFPYPEYSEVFFGDEYRVLRGGSWATRPGAIRNTFRNWDLPRRRQIRCVRDAKSRAGARADTHAEGRLVSLLLRRARLGALRSHHPASRVLPHPRRARAADAHRVRADRGGATARIGRVRSGERAQDADPAGRDDGGGESRGLRSGRCQRGLPARDREPAARGVFRAEGAPPGGGYEAWPPVCGPAAAAPRVRTPGEHNRQLRP